MAKPRSVVTKQWQDWISIGQMAKLRLGLVIMAEMIKKTL